MTTCGGIKLSLLWHRWWFCTWINVDFKSKVIFIFTYQQFCQVCSYQNLIWTLFHITCFTIRRYSCRRTIIQTTISNQLTIMPWNSYINQWLCFNFKCHYNTNPGKFQYQDKYSRCKDKTASWNFYFSDANPITCNGVHSIHTQNPVVNTWLLLFVWAWREEQMPLIVQILRFTQVRDSRSLLA